MIIDFKEEANFTKNYCFKKGYSKTKTVNENNNFHEKKFKEIECIQEFLSHFNTKF